MTSVKIGLKAASDFNKKSRICYTITHGGCSCTVNSSILLYPWEWDEQTSTIIKKCSSDSLDQELNQASSEIKRDLRAIYQIISKLIEDTASFTADDIIQQFQQQRQSLSLSKFMQDQIKYLLSEGKTGTAATYSTTLNCFMRFMNHHDIMLDSIDSSLIKSYEGYLQEKGLTKNTSSFYMRVLRSIYNQAVNRGLIASTQPFNNVYTGVAKTNKRAVDIKVIRKISAIDLPCKSQLDFARDIFMFSFYTRGMAFVDIAYLTSDNIKDGYLIYRRHKTGRELRIKWERCMQQLVLKYKTPCNNHLFPIIKEAANGRRQYLNSLHKVNHQLKALSSILGVEPALTMYVARHSWASIAKNNNIPITVISEGMGHSSIQTTQIYLASLNNSIIDMANKKKLTCWNMSLSQYISK